MSGKITLQQRLKKAKIANVNQLKRHVSPTYQYKKKIYDVRILVNSNLSQEQRKLIWDLLEENMRDLISKSSLGWAEKEKRKEVFSVNSRFILVYENNGEESDRGTPSGAFVGYSMFKFEEEEGELLLYCYELQIRRPYQRQGIGKFLIKQLRALGSHFQMEKIMLTVLKSNPTAMDLYKSNGFILDPASPSFVEPDEELSEEEANCDYEILSLIL